MNPDTLPPVVYLSRAVLSAKGLRDVYAVHQRLWRAFPGWSLPDPVHGRRTGPDGSVSPWPAFLWRGDRLRDDEGVRFKCLIQSVVAPAWEHLSDGLLQHETRALRWSFQPGQTRRFFLRANPTQARKDARQVVDDSGRTMASLSAEDYRATRGRRVAMWNADDQLAWLERKLAAAGATWTTKDFTDAPFEADPSSKSIPSVQTLGQRSWHWQRAGRHDQQATHAQHDGVDFEGSLIVQDPIALQRALLLGLGTAKSMGFGLLSLALSPDETTPLR